MAYATAVMGAIALGTTIAQGVKARQAKKKANKLLAEGQTMDNISELSKNQQIAEDVSKMGGMTSQEYQTAQQNISRNQSAGISALGGRKSALAGVGTLVQRANDATANLDAHNAAVSRANKLQGAQMQINANTAKNARRAANINRDYFNPAAQATAESQALTGAAIQNAAGVASSIAQMSMYKNANKPQGSAPASAATVAPPVDVVSKYRIPKYRVNANY